MSYSPFRKRDRRMSNYTRNIVGGAVTLGVGGAVLGQFEGQPGVPSNLSANTVGKASTMYGAMIPATMGMGMLGYFNQQQREMEYHKRRYRRK